MWQRSEEEDDELAELEQRLKEANLPEHALKVAQKELKVRHWQDCSHTLHVVTGEREGWVCSFEYFQSVCV